jgi:hypothetical protein
MSKHQLPPVDPSLLNEPRISLTALAQRENVHSATSWRWSFKGINGHRLESFSVGHRRFTTLPAFERWIAKINSDDLPAPSASPSQMKRDELVDQQLAAMGVK